MEKVDYTRYRKRLCSVGIPTTKGNKEQQIVKLVKNKFKTADFGDHKTIPVYCTIFQHFNFGDILTAFFSDENICGCGRSINDMCHGSHKKEEEDRGTWDFRKHTKLSVTGLWQHIFKYNNE